MRTTIRIDDDVLQAAKELARTQQKTAGQVLSELARRALTAAPDIAADDPDRAFMGFAPFGPRGGVVTNETIDRIREQEGI